MSDKQLGKLALASTFGAAVCFAGAIAIANGQEWGLIALGAWLIVAGVYIATIIG